MRSNAGKPAARNRGNNLNLNQSWHRAAFLFRQQVGGGNTRASIGLLAIGGGWASHVSFHKRQTGAASACRAMGALRTTRHISQTNRSDFLQLLRVAPDVDEPLLSNVAAGQRKLHARIKLTVGRNV